MEILQRDLRVTITGPTTLWAFLTSLQMGFRTLAIEKRSGEVWRVLGAVRTEFEKFGTVLKKAQERINLASRDLDDLVGVRTKQIQRKLREVQELPVKEAAQLLEETIIESEDSSEMVSDTTAPETRI
jgi:DNA recombination protein RmuC